MTDKKFSITDAEYRKFVRELRKGRLQGKTDGEAFYIYFKLESYLDQTQFMNIWAKDGLHALSSIMVNFVKK